MNGPQASPTTGDAMARTRALLEVNNAVVTHLTQERLFQAIAAALHHVLPFDRTAIFLHDPVRDLLSLFVLESSVPSEYFVPGLEMPAGDSHVGWVLKHRQPLLRRDLARERHYPMEHHAFRDGIRSFVIVPLVARSSAIGTLAVASRQAEQYSESDAGFLQEVANQVALAIENMKAYEALAASSRQHARLLDEVRREMEERRRAEEILRALTEGTASVTGAEFFGSLVRHLAGALGVRYAFVTECQGIPPVKTRTLAFWKGTALADDHECELAPTPCLRVLEGEIVQIGRGVQQLFPGDRDLVTLGAESYLGIPMFGGAGQLMGHLAVLDDRPMDPDPRALRVLRIFAARAGAELERKRAEESLRQMHQFSQEIVSGASEGIIVYDTALRYVVFNRFMEEMTGTPADEVLGRHAPDVFPFLRDQGLATLVERALGGEVIRTPDLLVRMPNGREVWESSTYGPHRDAEGRVVGVIALVSDVTRRKQAEDALREALTEVERLKNRLQAENVYLQEEIRTVHNFTEIVGDSRPLLDALRRLELVAPTDSTVLIQGETGTGKELFARALHSRSPRRDRPLVKVNCGAIAQGLVESELFGHVKGAFTGALEPRSGRFELADRGTLFLDEVSELPLETQVKLLRVLQEGEFEPVGSSRTIRVDVRVIAATNRNLEEGVRAGTFRADLYYRLNVVPLAVPPLRERRGDIPQLVMFFVTQLSRRLGRKVEAVAESTMDRLSRYPWPGNVRELRNVIERALVLSPGPVLDLGEELVPVGAPAATRGDGAQEDRYPRVPDGGAPRAGTEPRTLQDMERHHILTVLEQTGGVIEGPQGAARVLGLHPNTLRSRMERLGIKRPRRRALSS